MRKPRKTNTSLTHGTVVVILAGGLGTRLRRAFRAGPKVLAPVAGSPFLDYLLNWVRFAGFSEVVLCVGYKREQIQKRYRSGEDWGLQLSYSLENQPLGTAGAIKLAQNRIRSKHFVVLNGDSFVDVDFDALLQFHKRRRALGTITLTKAPSADRYGHVQVNRIGRILAFAEKNSSSSSTDRQPRWINAGVYVFRREVLELIPSGEKVSLERDVFQKINSLPFYGFPVPGYFIDIGIPDDYEKAQTQFRKYFLYEHTS